MKHAYPHRALLLTTYLCLVLLLSQVRQTFSSGQHKINLPVVAHLTAAPALAVVPFAEGFYSDTITDIASAGDGRLFVVERHGTIRVVQPDGTVLTTPFLNIRNQVATENWEQGLLGLVFHPNYPAVPYFYVSYTYHDNNQVHIARFTVSPDPNVADRDSKVILMTIDKTLPDSLVHNGGDLSFGPDGYLYISIGDGGPDPHFGSSEVHDPANNGYRTNTLLGKILRIDVNGTGQTPPDVSCSGIRNYTIPAGNPFADGSDPNCDEIWSKGLRNPWRFSFDRLTGDMFIADVGEWQREEINFDPAGSTGGRDYGWRCWEGTYDQTIPHPIIASGCAPVEAYTFPIYEYPSTEGCSIVGGFVYRGSAYPALQGHYIYGDFCYGTLRLLSRTLGGGWVQTLNQPVGFNISTFGEDTNGEIYLGRWRSDGQPNILYRLVAVNQPTP